MGRGKELTDVEFFSRHFTDYSRLYRYVGEKEYLYNLMAKYIETPRILEILTSGLLDRPAALHIFFHKGTTVCKTSA
jgi:hypothetical protein